MLVKHIHSYALERLKYVAALFLIVAVVFTSLLSYSLSNQGAENSYKSESQALLDKVGQLRSKIEKSEAAIKEWNKGLRRKHEFREGIQVDFSKALLSKLEAKYRVKDLNITLSSPDVRHDFPNTKFIDVIGSVLTLTFYTYIDIDAYSFVTELQQELPGFVQIKEVSFIGLNEINEEVLASIERGDKNDIVSVKLELVWCDVKDKPEVAAQVKAKVDDILKAKAKSEQQGAKVQVLDLKTNDQSKAAK